MSHNFAAAQQTSTAKLPVFSLQNFKEVWINDTKLTSEKACNQHYFEFGGSNQ